MENQLQLIFEMQLMAGKLIFVQVVGIIMLLVGLITLGFCKNQNCVHDNDKWVITGALLAIIGFSFYFFFRYDIHNIITLRELSDENIWHYYENQLFTLLWAFAWLDSIVLFLVVLCTGGLARSFYSPVYLLIPAVTLLLQEKTDLQPTILLFGACLIFITVSALFSGCNIDGKLKGKLRLNPTTDHRGYNVCLCAITWLAAILTFADYFVKIIFKGTA
ncbi:MAG TPA: hypothetical protein VKB86_04430 [Pyrinomonadaceae bacterium]|nr:hypothetical protein [Pyrinomonadaceae bacterium]